MKKVKNKNDMSKKQKQNGTIRAKHNGIYKKVAVKTNSTRIIKLIDKKTYLTPKLPSVVAQPARR